MNKIFIIAEAGVNHNGRLDLALQLVDIAKEAGADAVKFQTFKAENVVSKSAVKAIYQIENTKNSESQYEMIKKLELSISDHITIINYCKHKDIEFMSAPFDIDSIKALIELNVAKLKIPSGEITNLPYLIEISKSKKPIIMSTGMCNMQEIKDAIDILLDKGNGIPLENITILHCNTEYPTPFSDVNLLAIQTIKNKLGVKVGYSDHTLGIEVPIAAAALGASVIEKHFTISREMDGPDHLASLEPKELKQMVLSVRNIEDALGDNEKKVSYSEMKNVSIARKSIHLSRNVKKGDTIVADDLTMKRPGDGITPMKMFDVIGKKYLNNFEADYKLSPNDFR